MYPLWITNLFFKNPCVKCRKDVTIDDIVAIGVCRPKPYEAHLREAYALVGATCKHCGQGQNIMTRFPKPLLGEAIDALIDEIESAPTAKPLLGPGSVAPGNARECATKDESTPANPAKLRPSIRPGQKMDKPTDAEVESFLSWLKGMSFKVGSKGIKRLTGNHKINPDDNHNVE